MKFKHKKKTSFVKIKYHWISFSFSSTNSMYSEILLWGHLHQKWTLRKDGLSSGVEINTFTFWIALWSGISRAGGFLSRWPLERGSTVCRIHIVLIVVRFIHYSCTWRKTSSLLQSVWCWFGLWSWIVASLTSAPTSATVMPAHQVCHVEVTKVMLYADQKGFGFSLRGKYANEPLSDPPIISRLEPSGAAERLVFIDIID